MANVPYSLVGELLVHPILENVIKNEVCAGTEVSPSLFWSTLQTLVTEFGARNLSLLRKRDSLQAQIDAYHLQRKGQEWDSSDYAKFLTNIGYLVPPAPEFEITTSDVDPEVATIAGPQLVVPVDKARFALNAANARWGSLLDAFYGTDAGPEETPGLEKGSSYNPKRGAKVFELTHGILDEIFPLASNASSWNDISKVIISSDGAKLSFQLDGAKTCELKNIKQFAGYNLKDGNISTVLLKNNDLHVELKVNPQSTIGKTHKAGLEDVILESAITAIADFEDSVTAVDAEDKSNIYKNWARLMKGTLEETFAKGSKNVSRKLSPDKVFIKAGSTSEKLVLPGRVVLLVRNVGLHMLTNAVKIKKTNALIPENFLDLVVTAVSALHDLGANSNKKQTFNSRTGSVYIVKPKMHGPEEVSFAVETFARVEQLLNLPKNMLKIGVMDEERRTTATLKECIYVARERLIFINTGFMDRTGDEFHTSMQAGVFLPKTQVKEAKWLDAYEKWNVEVGIKCGLVGKAQIGKGMWAAPDSMKEMLVKKIGHPKAGANCAWVPSPTAATLHAIHYHRAYVKQVQAKLKQSYVKGDKNSLAKLSDILTPPLISLFDKKFELTADIIKHELDNNCQAILGYVSRWVIMGVGCSKVPDIKDEPLMEDRATLRINSQHITNWLLHGVVSEQQVLESMKKMAKIVDKQNEAEVKNGYKNLTDEGRSGGINAMQCALELAFNGLNVPNGLTEYSLTKFRLAEKAGHIINRL